MNIERILKLADYIEYHPEKFDMSQWMSLNILYSSKKAKELHHTCGTSACIAGHCVVLFFPEMRLSEVYGFATLGRRALELNEDDDGVAISNALFTPTRYANGINMWEVTNLHAAKCLRHLARTGEVDWVSTKPTRFEVFKNKAICYMLDFFR